jgi:hypothetical protein
VFVLEHFERIVVQLSQSLLYSLVGPTHEHNSLPILVVSVTDAWVCHVTDDITLLFVIRTQLRIWRNVYAVVWHNNHCLSIYVFI